MGDARGLALPSDFGELSRAAAVPVPLLRRGTGAKKKGASPQQSAKQQGAQRAEAFPQAKGEAQQLPPQRQVGLGLLPPAE